MNIHAVSVSRSRRSSARRCTCGNADAARPGTCASGSEGVRSWHQATAPSAAAPSSGTCHHDPGSFVRCSPMSHPATALTATRTAIPRPTRRPRSPGGKFRS